jgi:plastocyanin
MSATLPDPVIVAHRLFAVLGALILAGAMMVFGAPSTLATSAQSSTGSQAAGTTISITDELSRQHLMATPGTTVTWVNNDNAVHRIKSDKGASIEFDSGVLEPGERFSHRFASASDVTYRDALDAGNSSYHGMVMVMTMRPVDAGAATATTALAPLASSQSQSQPFVLASSGSGSDGDGGSAGGPNAKHVTVDLHGDHDIRPAVVTIAKGGSVTWFNDDSEDHTASGAGGINSGRLHRDESYTHTFNKPGTYDYVCAYHSAMQGTVRVANASGDVPPPPDNGGGGNNPPPPSNGGQKVAVSIGANFSPRNVTIPAGSVVTWTNNDGSPHTATGQGGINSGNLNGGQSYSKTFNTPGTYAYVCSYHSDMSGTIRVTNASGNVPPPPPGGGGGGGNPPPPGGGGGKTPAPPPPGGGGGGGTKAPAKASISIKDDFFSPKTVTIAAGGTVSWTNTGKNAHTVTGNGFDSGPVMSGGKWSHKFSAAGTYTYQCVFHSGMTATVKVVGAGGKVPPGGGGKAPGGGGKAPGGGGTAPGGGGTAPGGGAAPAPGSKTVTVTMGADSFSPSSVSARVGDTVVWKNASSVPHTVTGGPLDSGTVMPGQSYTTVLRQQGTISYKCEFHTGMNGTVKVAAAPAGVKLPPPSADTGVSGPSAGGSLPSTSTGSSSSDASSAAPAPGSKSYTINMTGSAFDPQVLEARVGDKITWVNKDPMPHNVTGGSLDSGTMMPGATYTTVLSEPGTIEYECTFHPGMTGTLKVAAAPPGTEVPTGGDSSTSGSSSMEGMDMGSKPSQESADPSEGAENHQVDIVNFMYDPDPLEVHVGDTVTFTNKDAAPHTATAEDKSWDSGNLNQGDSWTLKVEKVGTFHYICTYHPTMAGTLIVKPKSEEISASSSASDSGGAATTMTSASQVAGFSSGWLALLAFLAGLQLQSRFSSRRNSNSV